MSIFAFRSGNPSILSIGGAATMLFQTGRKRLTYRMIAAKGVLDMAINVVSKAREVAYWAHQSGQCTFRAVMDHVNETWPQLKPKVRADIISKAWGNIQKKGSAK